MPTHKLQKPDGPYITKIRKHLEGVWSMTHANWRDKVDPWYWHNVKIWPAGVVRPEYIPSTARRVIDNASDTQLAFEPKFIRPVIGSASGNVEDEEAADRVEAGLSAVFFDSMLEETEIAFKQFGKYLGMYGYAVLEGPVLDLNERPEKPVKDEDGKETDEEFKWREIDYKNSKRQWNPIRIRCPHPARVLIDPTVGRNIKEAVVHDRKYVGHLRDMVEGLRERNKSNPKRKTETIIDKFPAPEDNYFEAVEATEYWSTEWHGMMLGAELLFLEKNAYGFVPYNHAFAGFGQEKTDNQTADPFFKAQGLIDGVLPGLFVEAQSASAQHNALVERGFLQRWVSQASDPAEVKEQLDGDGIAQVDKDETGFIEYPEYSRALLQIGDIASKDIESGTFPRDVSGQRQQGVTTVGQQAMLLVSGNKRFASLNIHINMAATTIGMNCLRLLDRLGITIEAGGKRLDPKDLNHDYSVTAEFQTFDAVLQLQRREIGMAEVGQGLKSPQTYRETDLQVPNESEEFKRLIKEKVRNSPEYISIIARKLAEEDGMIEAVENLRLEGREGGGGAAMESSEISDEAGGGGPRGIVNALTPESAQPNRMPVPTGSR